MIMRTVSLRELRANKPANVEILPTAQPRQVQQKYNRKKREAVRDLRNRHAERFGYRHPHVRAQMKTAEVLLEVEQEPSLHILLAMISQMGAKDIEMLTLLLERRSASESAEKALALVQYYSMNIGNRVALDTAIMILKRERGL